MYKNIIDFLADVISTKKEYRYNSGNDYEVIKYKETNENGINIFELSQYEKNNSDAYYKGIIFDYELIQLFSKQNMQRDYKHAIALN